MIKVEQVTKTRYFAHHESDCAWRVPHCTEEELKQELGGDPCVCLISKEAFLALEKEGYEVHY